MQYDIDAIRAESDSPGKALYRFWEILINTDRETWFDAERIVMDSWAFDSTMGNGINDLIINEDYHVIANGVRSLKLLDRPRLLEFSKTVELVFREHGIEATSEGSMASLETLSNDVRASLEAALHDAEEPFLNEIWHQGLILVALNEYIDNNLEVFRQRKMEKHPSDV